MSTLKVNKIRDTAGSADSITLDPNGGAVIAGVTTVSTVKVGSGVTISSDGDIFTTGIGTFSSVKLSPDSGGGSFEVKAPSSSANTRILTLPDTTNGTILTTTSSDADRYKAGEIVQVIFGEITNDYSSGDFSDMTSSSYTNYGNLKLTITPKFNDSKLIFETNVNARLDDDNGHARYRLYDTTNSRLVGGEQLSHYYYAPTNAYPNVHMRLIGTSGYTTAFVCQVQVEINSGGTLNSDFSGSKYCSMTLTEVRQ